MPFNVGPLELVIVLVIALLVIGPKRLPEMGNSLGKSIREFRKASTEVTDAVSLDAEPKPAVQQAAATPVAPAPAATAAAPAADGAAAPATPAETPAPAAVTAETATAETATAENAPAENAPAETPAEPKSDDV